MKKGDIVYLDFDLKIKESGDYYKTTKEDVAKENDIYDEKMLYEPRAVIVGSGFENLGFDNALLEMDVGDAKEIEVSEEDAYGPRDAKQIELVPMRALLKLPQFKEGESYPVPGMPVRIGNKEGYIRTVGAGRVRVDYNHPLAGKDLQYNISIIKKAETDEDSVKAIFDMHYPTRAVPEIRLDGEMVKIVLPEMCKYDQMWQGVKFMIIAALREHLTVKNFQLIEEYKEHKSTADVEDGHDHDHDHDHEDDDHDHDAEVADVAEGDGEGSKEEESEEEKKEDPSDE